jgi:hypothetical protein
MIRIKAFGRCVNKSRRKAAILLSTYLALGLINLVQGEGYRTRFSRTRKSLTEAKRKEGFLPERLALVIILHRPSVSSRRITRAKSGLV